MPWQSHRSTDRVELKQSGLPYQCLVHISKIIFNAIMYTHYRMAVAANDRRDVFEDSLSENNGMQSSGCINTIKVGGGKCSCAEF